MLTMEGDKSGQVVLVADAESLHRLSGEVGSGISPALRGEEAVDELVFRRQGGKLPVSAPCKTTFGTVCLRVYHIVHDPQASADSRLCNAIRRSANRVSENHWLLFRQLSAVRYGRSNLE